MRHNTTPCQSLADQLRAMPQWHKSTKRHYECARLYAKRGESLPWSKLTADTVRAARAEHERARAAIRYINENYSVAGLARKYGVSASTMDKAIRRETWGHV